LIAACFVALASATVPARSASAEPKAPESPTLPAKLTLPDAMSLFRARGLDLLIADAAIESARADERSAGFVPNPSVNGGLGRSFGYDASAVCQQNGSTGCSPWMIQLGVSDGGAITDTLWNKRGLRKRVAESATAAARMARADAERTVGFAVKQAYIGVVLSQDQLEFTREALEANERSFELMKIRYEKGAINEADLARIETAKLESEQQVDGALQTLRSAKITLAYLLGVRTLVPDFDVDDTVLKFSVPAPLSAASREALVRAAYDHRPDLRGYVYMQQRAQASIDLARRQRYPDFTFSLSYSQEGTGNSAISPPTLIGGVSVPIPLFYNQQGEIMKAEADLKSQTYQRAKVEAQVINDVEAAFTTFVASKSRVERMENRLLDRSRKARDLVRIQYDKGAASLLEYLDAQRTFIAVNVEYLQNLNDYWTAVVSLEQAVGTEYLR
jgi:cobalt-zinc-cadmium efflux system outer membrane protein